MAFSNEKNAGNFRTISTGGKGFKLLSGTTVTATGEFHAISTIKESTITATSVVGESLTSVVVPAGMTILGRFTAVTIAAGGELLAYNAC
jgi:hypothetical protein